MPRLNSSVNVQYERLYYYLYFSRRNITVYGVVRGELINN